MAKDRGWEYLNSSGDDFDYDKDNDGSWGYENEDGSGSFYGNDGSWGYKNSDGSASYYGADGSWGYKNSDGSSSYYGNDGSWGYKNSDGSGSFYGGDGDSEYYSSDDDDEDDSDSGSSGGSLLGALIGAGIAVYAVSKLAKSSSGYSSYDDDDDDDDDDDNDDDDDAYDYYNSEEYQAKMREEAQRRAEEERRLVEEQRIKKEQRKEKRRRVWGVITGKKFEAGISSTSCRGMELDAVVHHFENQGFYNISSAIVEDLPLERIHEEGTIESVTINNSNSFETVTLFPINAKINVLYHKLIRVEPPLTSRGARKKQVRDVIEQFQSAGFVYIEERVLSDLSMGWLVKDESVERVEIDGKNDYRRSDKIRLDAHIIVTYHTFKNK